MVFSIVQGFDEVNLICYGFALFIYKKNKKNIRSMFITRRAQATELQVHTKS